MICVGGYVRVVVSPRGRLPVRSTSRNQQRHTAAPAVRPVTHTSDVCTASAATNFRHIVQAIVHAKSGNPGKPELASALACNSTHATRYKLRLCCGDLRVRSHKNGQSHVGRRDWRIWRKKNLVSCILLHSTAHHSAKSTEFILLSGTVIEILKLVFKMKL